MEVFIGIDVSKATLDIASLPDGEAWTVANDEPGVAELTLRFMTLTPKLIVLESTGGFESLAATTLAKAGLPTCAGCTHRDVTKSLRMSCQERSSQLLSFIAIT